MRTLVAFSVFVFLLASAAHADIYEWKDSDGVRHFTNIKEQLPGGASGTATVFVQTPPSPAGVNPITASPGTPSLTESETPRQAQVIYDQRSLDAAYEEGWREAMARERAAEIRPPAVSVHIDAPLVSASGPVYANGYSSDGYAYGLPYRPLVTTSFDRGRSRHLTLRLLLQNQFALDREGPYVVERFLPPLHHPPLGPALQVFLPRGLSHFRPPSRRAINY